MVPTVTQRGLGRFNNFPFTSENVVGDNLVLSVPVINLLVDQFWQEVMMSPRIADNVVMLQLQVESQDHFYSLSKLQTVNVHTRDALKTVFQLSLERYYSKYQEYPIDTIFIRWRVLAKSDPLAVVKLQKDAKDVTRVSLLTTYNLPATMNLKKWNNELSKAGYELIHTDKYLTIFYNTSNKSKILISIKKRERTYSYFLCGRPNGLILYGYLN